MDKCTIISQDLTILNVLLILPHSKQVNDCNITDVSTVEKIKLKCELTKASLNYMLGTNYRAGQVFGQYINKEGKIIVFGLK